jgi:predicted ATP-dependent endonuclease of OLD family
LESQGDGIKRQIWFALLKWKALRGGDPEVRHKDFIWCFDEPETHLYPKAQREFFEILKKIAGEEFQIVISTHSTTFIDRASFAEIKNFELLDAYTVISKCEDAVGVYKALEIRNSDFLFFDKFLVVEGDTEEVLVPHLFSLTTNSSLVERGIQLIKLGGKDKRKNHCVIFESLLKDFNKERQNVVYLLDSDVRYEMTRDEIAVFCEFTAGKQDMEDSLPTSVWDEIIRATLGPHGIQISLDAIDEILSAIPTDRAIQSNQKFYAALRSRLKEGLTDDKRHLVETGLPSKGRELGSLLKAHIIHADQISQKIKDAFNRLCEK